MPAATPTSASRWIPVTVALALVAGTLWLRAPGFAFRTWNVDEAIHAAVARTLLDGGVLYRDAIDQRTPLTYVVMAGIFKVAGANNLMAAHVLIALLIAATGWLLFQIARRFAGRGAGAWAALLCMMLSTGLFYQGDANAFVTEWFVAFFAVAGAWVFWSLPEGAPGPGRLLLTGVMFSLSFLSKQPGLLDLAAPALTLGWLALRGPAPARRQLAMQWGALLLGFAAPVLLTLAYYAAQGALRDLLYYAWSYNLDVYGPEVGWGGRLASAGAPFRLLAGFSPLLLGLLALSFLIALRLLVRRSSTLPPAQAADAYRVYLLAWGLSSLAGVASGGRGFDHYSIQFLPVVCLATGWLLGELTRISLQGPGRPHYRLVLGAGLVAVLALLGMKVAAARQRTLPLDPSVRVARYMSDRSLASDRIFVWGYHPDVYLFSDRRPASRFVYASFLTGLIPWTNVAPERDTAYAVVPGAMDTLLHDLERNRPVFIVDCSAGPNRHWDKYPLAQFPPLAAFVRQHYVAIEEDTFVQQGFRLYAIMDGFRTVGPVLPPASAGPARAGYVDLETPPAATGASTRVKVSAHDPAGRLCRLELLVDGAPVAALTLGPGEGLVASFEPSVPAHSGRHRVQARAVCADGTVFVSAPGELETEPSLMTAGALAAFGLPLPAGLLLPVEGSARFGASAGREGNHMIFFAHAPSRLRYPLPSGVKSIRGGMGFRPGAYAPDNAHPTDGAEFRVVWLPASGSARLLFHQLLRPGQNAADRGVVPFAVELPSGADGQVEFVIDPGPTGSPASDWTYWADLALETSR